MKERSFEVLEQELDKMLENPSRLHTPIIEMQHYEALMNKVASENSGDFEMLEFGARMLHKIYEAKTAIYCAWMDTLENETYRALEKYVFVSNKE